MGGRWSEEAYSFLVLLARCKAQTAPAALRCSFEYCLVRRWTGLLGCAAQVAFAASLLGEGSATAEYWNDALPPLVVCLGKDRAAANVGPSRLPAPR